MYDLPQGKWRDMNPCRLGVTMTLPRGMIIGICVQNIYSLNTEGHHQDQLRRITHQRQRAEPHEALLEGAQVPRIPLKRRQSLERRLGREVLALHRPEATLSKTTGHTPHDSDAGRPLYLGLGPPGGSLRKTCS